MVLMVEIANIQKTKGYSECFGSASMRHAFLGTFYLLLGLDFSALSKSLL